MHSGDPKKNPTFDQLRGNPVAGDGERGFFEADDGVRIFYECWAPKDRPAEKLLVAFHGLAAHSRYLATLADTLVPHGVAVAVMDFRGHGLSGGRQGDPDPAQFVVDAKKFCTLMREKFGRVPLFTLGESMGGAVNAALNISPPEGVSGMILLAPAIAPPSSFSLKHFLLFPAYLFTLIFAPWVRIIKMTGDEHLGMRDPLNMKYDREDPHHLKYVTTRMMLRLKGIMDRARTIGPREIKAPCLAIQGGEDVAVNADAVRSFVEQLPNSDKKFVFYPSAPHCMIYDPEAAPLLRAEIRDWILSH